MEDVITSLLTDASVRSDVEQVLLSVGTDGNPWF